MGSLLGCWAGRVDDDGGGGGGGWRIRQNEGRYWRW